MWLEILAEVCIKTFDDLLCRCASDCELFVYLQTPIGKERSSRARDSAATCWKVLATKDCK
jgi:hypothetical protein